MKQIICYQSGDRVFQNKSQALTQDVVTLAEEIERKLRKKREDKIHISCSFDHTWKALILLAQYRDEFDEDLRRLGELLCLVHAAELEEDGDNKERQ